MAIKNWRKYGKELWQESQKAWDWLRRLADYKADYRAMIDADFRASKKYLENMQQPGATILTTPPVPNALAEKLKIKWGFYPLINPSIRRLPADFFYHISRLFSLSGTEAGVRHEGFNYIHIMKQGKKTGQYEYRTKKDLPALPESISFEINPMLPILPTLAYIKDFLADVQRIYNIRPSRPNAIWVSLKYKAYVLRQLGVSEEKVRAAVIPLDWSQPLSDDRRQCIFRIMKESKEVFV